MSYLSSAQVAEKIGTTPGNLRQLRFRGKFPEPDLAPNRQTPLWAVTTIDEWMAGELARKGKHERPDTDSP